MTTVIQLIEVFFSRIPLPLLEIWGRLGYILGFCLMICAFGRITFKPGDQWRVGLEQQTWNSKALQSMVLTFVLIISTGYIGSSIVLVPGAQTFESLKDLSVFLCIILFGYPALVIVPFAYGISDLFEGIPPAYMRDWFFGYFINPACFWVAYQFIGRNPDFRRAKTWGWYLFFVIIFLCVEPVLWGYICSPQFTSAISFRNITPALFFTTSITWFIAPFAMLAAFPLARKFGLFWAEIPKHVKERVFKKRDWIWVRGMAETGPDSDESVQGMPIRMLIVTPFVFLVLLLVAATAFFVLRSAEIDANKLASRLHQEIADNINLQLDNYIDTTPDSPNSIRLKEINELFKKLHIAKEGRAFLIDHSGRLLASSLEDTLLTNPVHDLSAIDSSDPVVQNAVRNLYQRLDKPETLKTNIQFRFDIITAKPLSSERWLAQATYYHDKNGGHSDWILMTAIPDRYYMEGIQKGSSQTAMVLALALILSIVVAGLLASMVINPISRLSRASREFAKGDLTQRVPISPLEELGDLSLTFNKMAEQLAQSRERIQLATRALSLGIWDWDIVTDVLIWDEQMYRLYGIKEKEFGGAYDAWIRRISPEDLERANAEIQAALRGEREYICDFRIVWPDGSVHFIQAASQTFRDKDGKPLRMVGVNYDITERKKDEKDLQTNREDLIESQRIAHVGSWRLDISSNQVVWSEELYKMYGFDPALPPPPYTEHQKLFTAESWEKLSSALSNTRDTGIPYELELETLRVDGSRGWMWVRGETILDDNGVTVGLRGAAQDITERKRAEKEKKDLQEQLNRAQKIESIGTLAGGVAHEINNPINGIMNYAQLIIDKLGPDNPVSEYSDGIIHETKRVAKIVRNLLVFARKDKEYHSPARITDIVNDTMSLIQAVLRRDQIILAVDVSEDLPKIKCRSQQIQQVLMNLVTNARDSLNEKYSGYDKNKNIEISSSLFMKDGRRWIRTTVKDWGMGIDPNNKDKLFDPFFTTKGRTAGTGLGLSISYGIVKDHHGVLTFQSEPGKYSQFHMDLPVDNGWDLEKNGNGMV